MASALSDALARHKIVIDHVTTLIDAREAARLLSYDAILLDRQLTDGEGLKLIPELRAEGIDMPIIVLVAHNDHEGRIRGLDLGADDYMVKLLWRSAAPSPAKRWPTRCMTSTWRSSRTRWIPMSPASGRN